MPRLSVNGNIGMGIAGHQGSINGNLIPGAFGVYWMNGQDTAFINSNDVGITKYNFVTGVRTPQDPHAANDLRAGGDVWAAWLDHYGLFASTGHYDPVAGLLDVGPDGAIGYTPNRQSGVGCNVREVSGEVWNLTGGLVAELELLGAKRAIWRDFNFKFHTVNIPPTVQCPGGAWFPHAVFLNGEWWAMYFAGNYGLVLHPFSSTIGYVITPPGQDAWQPTCVALANNVVRVCWSTTAGEGPNDYRIFDCNIDVMPRVQIVQEETIPAINKKCWLGWFEFIDNLAYIPPSNNLLWLRQEGIIKQSNGSPFAKWIARGTVEEIERAVQESPYPALVYWDGRGWPRWPILRPQDWLGLFAYCPASLTMAQFEANMRADINGVPPQYKQIYLNCQCYNDNKGLTQDLKGLVPVYARLARDFPRVNFLLVFNDQGRGNAQVGGGLQWNPQLIPYWQKLKDGITGTPEVPVMDNGIVDGVCVDPEKYFFSLVAGTSPANDNYIAVLNRIGPDLYKYGIGQQKNSGGVPRGRLFMPWSQCPNAAPRNAHEEFLGVNQDAPCCGIGDVPCKKVDCVDFSGNVWTWVDRDPHIAYQPIPAQPGPDPEPGVVNCIITKYTNPARRSDPLGCVVEFEAQSPHAIVEISFTLNDGDLPFIWTRGAGSKDGRYYRVIGFKATVNGNWTLRLSAKDDKGNTGFTEVPLTVTF